MNQILNLVKLNSEIKIKPITIADTLDKNKDLFANKTFLSKICDALFFGTNDLNFEEWQRLESKPRSMRSSQHATCSYRGVLR